MPDFCIDTNVALTKYYITFTQFSHVNQASHIKKSVVPQFCIDTKVWHFIKSYKITIYRLYDKFNLV